MIFSDYSCVELGAQSVFMKIDSVRWPSCWLFIGSGTSAFAGQGEVRWCRHSCSS